MNAIRNANLYDKKSKEGLYKIRTYTERLKGCINKKDMKNIFLGIRKDRFTFYYYGYVLLNITVKKDKLVIITRDKFSSDYDTNKQYEEVMENIPLVRNYEKDKKTFKATKKGNHYEIYESDYIQPGCEKRTYSVKIIMNYLFSELMGIMEKHFKFKETTERAIQNRYTTEYNPNDEIYVVDMEFCMPGDIQKSIGKQIHGRYDMIALHNLGNNKYKLVFIELKSARSACRGSSGINDHIDDMKEFLEEYNKNSILKEAFKEFVKNTLDTKVELKLIPNIEYNIDFNNPEFWLLFDMQDKTNCSSIEKIEKVIGDETLHDKDKAYLKIYNGNILKSKKYLEVIKKEYLR